MSLKSFPFLDALRNLPCGREGGTQRGRSRDGAATDTLTIVQVTETGAPSRIEPAGQMGDYMGSLNPTSPVAEHEPTPSVPAYVNRSSRELIALARAGDSQALSALFTRQKASLKTWARGRLPQWARRALDTNDLIQEALLQTLRHIHRCSCKAPAVRAWWIHGAPTRITTCCQPTIADGFIVTTSWRSAPSSPIARGECLP